MPLATTFSQVHICLCFRETSFLSSTLMKEAAGSAEIPMNVCQTTWRHIPGDSNPWYWNLNSYVTVSAYTLGHMPKFSSKNEFEMWVLVWKVLWSQNSRLEVAACLKISLLWNHVVTPQNAVRTSHLTHYLNCQYNFSKAVCAVWIIYSLHYKLPLCIWTMTDWDNFGLIMQWV